jgi:nitrous oxidase accessory protein NosD
MSNPFGTPTFRPLSASATPIPGGLVYTYAAGTSTPQAAYQDAALTAPHTNPITLDAIGETTIWLDPALSYKINVEDALGVQIPNYPIDNIDGSSILAGIVTKDTVDTVAELTALTARSDDAIYQTLGYTAVGDGGAKRLRFDAASTATADGGAVLIPDDITHPDPGRFIDIDIEAGDRDVRKWGVTGDGSTDDTAALEAASAGGGPNSTVIIPPGFNCLVSSEVNLQAAGQRLLAYGATISRAAAFTGLAVVRVGAANVTIEGLTLDGNDKASDGISVTAGAADGMAIRHCEIYNCLYGISANSTSDVIVEHNYVHDVAAYSMRAHNIADTRPLSNIQVLSNRFDQSDQEPSTSTQAVLLIRGSATNLTSDCEVSGNTFIQCEDPASSSALNCELRYVDGAVVTGNYGKDGSMLVSVAIASNIVVSGNVCDGATFYGIEVAGIDPTGCFNIAVSGNTIRGRGRLNYGVGIQGTALSEGVVISGNSIQGTTLYGVFVNDQWDDVSITGNRIDITEDASGQFGIYLDGSSDHIDRVSISGNVLNGNDVGEKAIYLRDVRYASVSGNAMPEWTEHGVLLHSDDGTCEEIAVVGNTINGLTSTAIGKTGTLGAGVMTAFNPPYRKSGTTQVNDINLETGVIEAWGSGSPEGAVTAAVGSLYHDTAGSNGKTTHEKTSGTGNTGWRPLGVATQTAAVIADVASTINTSNKVIGRLCWDGTNTRLMVASGMAADDPWYVADGSSSVTPV